MKKTTIFGLTALVIMFSSCESYTEEKQFVADFAAAVNSGDEAKLEKIYPDFSSMDSLACEYNADSISVEKSEAEGKLIVKLNSKQSMIIEKSAEGGITILKSYGLFAYEPGVVEFGKALDCYDETLSDKENSERMNDKDFIGLLVHKADEFLKKNVRIEQRTYYNKVGISVFNNTGFVLPKGCYTVNVGVYFRGDGGGSLESSQSYSEEDIPNGGSSQFFVKQEVDDLSYVEAEITCNAHDMASLQKIYKPTGEEYKKYQEGGL